METHLKYQKTQLKVFPSMFFRSPHLNYYFCVCACLIFDTEIDNNSLDAVLSNIRVYAFKLKM